MVLWTIMFYKVGTASIPSEPGTMVAHIWLNKLLNDLAQIILEPKLTAIKTTKRYLGDNATVSLHSSPKVNIGQNLQGNSFQKLEETVQKRQSKYLPALKTVIIKKKKTHTHKKSLSLSLLWPLPLIIFGIFMHGKCQAGHTMQIWWVSKILVFMSYKIWVWVDCWWKQKNRVWGIDTGERAKVKWGTSLTSDVILKINTSNGKYHNLISWVYTMGFHWIQVLRG